MGKADRSVVPDGVADVEGGDIACSGRAVGYGDDNSSSAAAPVERGVALYARVSGADQRADLERPLSRLTEYAVSKKMCVTDAVKEVGSGMNGHRKGLLRLWRDPTARTVSVLVIPPNSA